MNFHRIDFDKMNVCKTSFDVMFCLGLLLYVTYEFTIFCRYDESQYAVGVLKSEIGEHKLHSNQVNSFAAYTFVIIIISFAQTCMSLKVCHF